MPSDSAAAETAIDTRSLRRSARTHLWASFAPPTPAHDDEPTILVEANGSRVTDSEGREYLDGISALEAMVIGHGRAELGQVASRQMEQMAFLDLFRYASVPSIELAERLAALAPGDLERVFFTPGGAEADEVAIKLARQFHSLRGEPTRQKVITRGGAFHGSTFGAMALDGNYWSTRNYVYEPTPTMGRIVPPPACPKCDLGKASRHLPCPHAIEAAIVSERPETVAAVVVDPAATAIAVAAPPPSYLRELREVCDRHGVLLIVDEIITGFARTGKMFCCEHSGVEPDLMTASKGLSSGYAPIGAALISERIAAAFEEAEAVFAHGHTYGGHPVACAVALANIDIIEREGLDQRAHEQGRYLLERLRELDSHPTYWDVRGIGLLAGVDLVADRSDGTPFPDQGEVGTTLRRRCKANGLITLPLHPGAVMFFAPPLVVTRDEIDAMVEAFDRSLTEVERELGYA